nr:hypothetical protein [Tanacetum cinerariifolium]
MFTSNQQTLTKSGANDRPPMLEKRNYTPWESRFKRFLDNKIEDGKRMWHSIEKGPYERPLITDRDNDQEKILELFLKWLNQSAKDMWERIKRLMFGSDVTSHVRHSRLMYKFDSTAAKEGESLDSVYEQLTTFVNVMDRNKVHPILVAINTKFLNCLQPEWSKYVTIIRHNQTGGKVTYNELYDSLAQFKPHVQVSKSHANPSYSQSPQSYYVIHPSSVVNYDEDYQGELQGDSQDDKLTTTMMNQSFNAVNRNDESNQIVQHVSRTESNQGKVNVQCYNYNEKGYYARDCSKPRVHDAKYFREQILLAMKDEVGSNLNDEDNYFMLDNSFGDETLKELIVVVIMMARIQPADDHAVKEPTYDAKAVSKVNTSNKIIPNRVHKDKNHRKCNTVVNTSADDQIDNSIIFDDPYV